MANFAGLLKKTIDAQQHPTLQLRARVYARARETVERKLAEANVPESVVRSQLKALDDAIKSVEADYLSVERELLSTIIKKPTVSPPVDVRDVHLPKQGEKKPVKPESATSPSRPAGKIEQQQTVSAPISAPTSHAANKEERARLANNLNKTSQRVESGAALSRPPLSAKEKTAHPFGDKPASRAPAEKKKNGLFGLSRKKTPEAEPVNLEKIIAAETDAQQEQSAKEEQSAKVLANNQQNGDYDIVSDIFVQAARRTERQAAKKRATIIGLSVAAVVIVVVGVLFTAWSFFSGKEKLANTEMSTKTTNSEQPKEKFTQRLLTDGSEVDEGPAKSEEKLGEGTSTAKGTTQAKTSEDLPGEATLYLARTETQDEKVQTGSVQWSLVKEKASPQHEEELAVRGNVTIPDEKLSLRLTLRRNTDPSLPAAYLIEAIFIVPDDFAGKAIDNVKELTFKDSEQSTGLQLTGTVEGKIGDNFFLFALTGDNPFRDRNLQLMKQLGWMRLVITDKNQRILELTFSKGPKGEEIFNDVINKWLEQDNKPTLYDQKQETTGRN
ncbi:hypothetical protein [uncultured Bartonella sp.]|uniref:hypothetical protein n=1 Tax=uncultured Bartonella sp. TaxID=104108 RepID=UPI00261E1190|nr:hypothetical protein [uncultured Bartonella sp.]